MQHPDADVKLYIVIVLYRMEPVASATYCTLLRSLTEPMARPPAFRVLLYDNAPPAKAPTGLPDHVSYFASPANTGLADAYNFAIAQAQAEGFGWLLTLDQDTDLPADFIPRLTEVAADCTPRAEIAAIVPHIRAGTRDVSPNWFAGGVRPRWFARGYHGVPQQDVYAFNSGALVRVAAAEAIGGYSRLFWLDYCDAYLFREIQKRHWKVFVAGDIHLQHDFSMMDIRNKMSLWRYQNAVEAGSAFYDLEMSPLAGLEHTLRLLLRLAKHLVRHDGVAVRRITAGMLWHRLFTPKAKRIEAWTDAQQRRIAGNGGGPA